MLLPPILALIIIRFLRQSLRRDGQLAKWDKMLLSGAILFVGIIALNIVFGNLGYKLTWLNHALLAGLLYLVFSQQELHKGKQIVFALLPVMGFYFVKDIIRLISYDFYKSWVNYFNAGELFAFIWMAAMLYINGKQRKALEKERLKAEEKEKEYKISETLKAALEVQVKERTAEITQQKEELQQALNELRSTQSQLIQSEKMASLGELTAGIAHEIQNPLNFVNNFSEVSNELIDEMTQAIDKGDNEEVKAIASDLKQNLEKINHHGKRADGIVKGMLQHSRRSNGQKEETDINKLADEYLRLAYHGLRAKDKSFNAGMKTAYDETIGMINIIPQDIGRVILNLITNAFYAVTDKKKSGIAGYEPTVTVSTKKMGNKVLVSVGDNGNGIPARVLDKIFQPFFTTKPTGEGTGLGLSMSYDIVTKGHGGELKVETKEGEGATFIIELPI